ncbi:hypothetical protein CCACVL1_07673 [Corchorus capsularis]|uniref:Uncharacterized protein n=1 Tax=Corchorus capsularis TaxID=210143 RepID=A0A1R3J4F9_COCAP|nr:hypothetical protein CCACVL1_07673 [Corchorus capsularis]
MEVGTATVETALRINVSFYCAVDS